MNDPLAEAAGEAIECLLLGNWDKAEMIIRLLPPNDVQVLYSMLQDFSALTAHLIIERGGLPHPPKEEGPE